MPTFTNLAGAQTPSYVDGRSLKLVLNGSSPLWRNAILIVGPQRDSVSPSYIGIRTINSRTKTKGKYVEYAGIERELYDLSRDPYELTNSYDLQAPPAKIVSRLQALKVRLWQGGGRGGQLPNG